MNKQRIRSYLPICIVVELVEIFCNYMMAAVMIQGATWLQATPPGQRAILTVLTYIVLSIIPMVGLLLAVVDMDLTISKNGGVGNVGGITSTYTAPKAAPVAAQSQVKPLVPVPAQPKWSASTNGTHPTMNMAPTASYPQGLCGCGGCKRGGSSTGDGWDFGARDKDRGRK